MNSLIRLTKFHLGYYMRPRFATKKERNKFIGIIALLAICFLMPAAMLIASVYFGASIAVKNNVLAEYMSVMFGSAQVATIFLGTATYIDIMYFSRDNKLLASLPIRTSHIYISKFAVCLCSMLMISTLIFLPAFISSAVAISNAGITLGAEYYIMGLIGIFYVPLVPLSIISILSFPVMKIVSFLKSKPVLMSVVTVVFSLAVIGVIWGGMFALEAHPNGESLDIAMLVATLSKVGKASYSTLVLSRAMLGVEIGMNIGIMIGILIGSTIINVLFSMLLYRGILSRLGEGSNKRVTAKRKLEYKASSTRFALLSREVRTVLRNPDFFVQTLMMIVLSPIMIVIFTLLDEGSNEGSNVNLFMTGTTFFYLTIMMGMNYLSAIGISRERENLAILKTMPVATRDIITVKIWLADIASIIGCLVCAITYVICVKVPWYYMIFMFVSGTIVSSAMNVFGLMRDIKKPNLKWINAREIVKNNFGAIVPMFVTMAMGMVVLITSAVLSFTPLDFGVQDAITWCITFVLSIVYYFAFRFKKMDTMIRYFDDIEP